MNRELRVVVEYLSESRYISVMNLIKTPGAEVQLECNRIINKLGLVNVGTAVMTSGGKLSKYIIHVVGPNRQHQVGKKLMLSTWNSLILADEAGLNSIGFHPISIECLGFNAKLCAEVMLPTIKKYSLEKSKNLRQISLYLSTLPDYKEFENILDSIEAPRAQQSNISADKIDNESRTQTNSIGKAGKEKKTLLLMFNPKGLSVYSTTNFILSFISSIETVLFNVIWLNTPKPPASETAIVNFVV